MVLESTTDSLDRGRTNVRGRVHELPVLAAGLADDAGVREVVVDVERNVLPERLEDVGRAGEVETGKVPVLEDLRTRQDGSVPAWGSQSNRTRRTLAVSLMVASPLGVGRNWMTFLGSPASRRIWKTIQDAYAAPGEGFQRRTFPTRAGAPTRFPPMAVKLNGVTAKTKPSRARYSTRLRDELGACQLGKP